MPAERLPMRQIREIFRLKWESHLSKRKIAESTGTARSTVSEYLRRAEAAGLRWPQVREMEEEEIEARLFPTNLTPPNERTQPDWHEIHQELRKKGVTLALLWQEYKARHPEGYQYSYFCDQYRQWAQTVDPVMRQTHSAGEKMFVDYCGLTMSVVDRESGEIRETQIFVAVLGASNYTYAEATWTQSLPDWIGAHVRAFAYYGGVPKIVVNDNLKSGVNHPCRYEPELNPAYQELADRYQVAILPARVRKPRDKAKVETGVQIVERWILAALRHHQFFSLLELNQAIREKVEELNQRPFQKLPGCRRSLFESLDQPVLHPLPVEPYEYAEWKKARVNLDYHIEVEGHYYSVPYKLIRQQVDIRFTARTVECFFKGKRVCSHVRNVQPGGQTTQKDHRPKSHQEYIGWTPERLLEEAGKIGSNTLALIREILQKRASPVQGLRSGLGILRLAKKDGEERLEKACHRALAIGAFSYTSIQSILKTGVENCPLPETSEKSSMPIEHSNIRGANYYH